MEQFRYHYQNAQVGIALEQSVYRTGSYHYNWHPELEFLVVLHGEIEVCSRLACCVLQEDDLILINSNSGHATFSREPGSIVMVLHADPRFFNRYFDDSACLQFSIVSDAGCRSEPRFQALRRQLAIIAENGRADTPERRLALDSAFYGLMNGIMSAFPPERVPTASFPMDESKQEALKAVLQYLQKNYRQTIRLDTLARTYGYNTNYLSQLFKSNLGINFHDYLTRIRLREATRQLSSTDEKILDIALENGFADLKSFNSVFRKTFRKSPSEYRRQIREDHLSSDLLFKKEFLPADAPVIREKLAQYQKAEEAPAQGPTTQLPDAALLREQVETLLHDAKAVSECAAEMEKTAANLWANYTNSAPKKREI